MHAVHIASIMIGHNSIACPFPLARGIGMQHFFFQLPPSASLAMDVQTHSKVVCLITDMCTYILRTGIQGEVPSQRFKLIRMLDIPKLHTFSLTNKFIQRILIANLDCQIGKEKDWLRRILCFPHDLFHQKPPHPVPQQLSRAARRKGSWMHAALCKMIG